MSVKVMVVYYSRYGHCRALAEAVGKGVKSVAGAELVMRRAAEFPEEIPALEKDDYARQVWQAHKDIPACTNDDLEAADGIIFGGPTRFGNMTAQLKRVFDGAAALWLAGAFEGKPAGVFTSTASTHGGQETTLLSMMIPLLHLGMLIVGVPYSTPGMIHTEARGGTPYGASAIAGPKNDQQPTPEDLAIAETLGRRLAQTTLKLRA